MNVRHPLLTVIALSTITLAAGFSRSPLWDEDEPRFAAVARAMIETGDWVVPTFNGTLAVDKPVLMHWAMAASYLVFGVSEFAARLPSAIAAVLAALAILRAGSRWFDPTVGTVGALAFVGCLLVGVESHAATPDAILVACTTWTTVLAAEGLLAGGAGPARLSFGRAVLVGGITGLGTLCKGPVGFVGPLAVAWLWAAWLMLSREDLAGRSIAGWCTAAVASLVRSAAHMRPVVTTLAMLAVAAPWYAAVTIRTDGAWPEGFFFVHNIGRFAEPMEKHAGSILYHPLTMLVGFYPWSCFLPLAMVLAAWRSASRSEEPTRRAALALFLFWIAIWVGTFSAAATKLPNYVLPAYPAAALLVAAAAVGAARQPAWRHPAWLATGLGWVVFGGVATAATILVAARYGLTAAEPAAVVGIVPIVGAVFCFLLGRRNHAAAVATMVLTGLVFTALAVGPAGSWIARANTLPRLVAEAETRLPGHRFAVFGFYSPNAVFYSPRPVTELVDSQRAEAVAFLRSGDDAVMLVRENEFAKLRPNLPPQIGVLSRMPELFREHDLLLVGTTDRATASAETGEVRR